MNTEKLANVNTELAGVVKFCLAELKSLNDALMGQVSEAPSILDSKAPPTPDGFFPYQTVFVQDTLQMAYELSSEISRLRNCVRPGQEPMPEPSYAAGVRR